MGIAAKVQKLGRIAIPQTYRKLYNIEEGDIVEFVITKVKRPDGTVIDFRDAAKEDIEISEAKGVEA